MDNITQKIIKLLALAERGGTEAEAKNAMSKAQILLAKHNLSLMDVKGKINNPEINENKIEGRPQNAKWEQQIWHNISKLYFCHFHISKSYHPVTHKKVMSYVIIGKTHNIKIVENIAQYVVTTGTKLAKEFRSNELASNPFLNGRHITKSFREGFAATISRECSRLIVEAREHGIQDKETGTALVVADVYDSEMENINEYISNQHINLTRTRARRTRVGSAAGYNAGQEAGLQVSLKAAGSLTT